MFKFTLDCLTLYIYFFYYSLVNQHSLTQFWIQRWHIAIVFFPLSCVSLTNHRACTSLCKINQSTFVENVRTFTFLHRNQMVHSPKYGNSYWHSSFGNMFPNWLTCPETLTQRMRWLWCCPHMNWALLSFGLLIVFSKYVGVIWFVFHVPQLLSITFTQQNSCCIYQKSDWESSFSSFSYGYWKCMVVDFPIVFTIECRVVINIWRCSPISFKHKSLWCLLFDPHRAIYRLHIGVWLPNGVT